jgi:hypothetical protein
MLCRGERVTGRAIRPGGYTRDWAAAAAAAAAAGGGGGGGGGGSTADATINHR